MMKISIKTRFLVVFLFLSMVIPGISATAQGTASPLKEESKATIDRKFTKMFARDCCRVTGADGEYSV